MQARHAMQSAASASEGCIASKMSGIAPRLPSTISNSGSSSSSQTTARIRSGRHAGSRSSLSVTCSAQTGGGPTGTLSGCRLVGVGSSVPASVLTNADLEQLVETNDEWIASRTGIRERHILAEGELLADHAAIAAQRAMEMAGVSPEEIDLVLLATSSPDDIFGSACQVGDVGRQTLLCMCGR